MSTCSMPARIRADTSRGRMNQTMLRPLLAPRSGSDGSFQYAAAAVRRAKAMRTKAERSSEKPRGMRALYSYTNWELMQSGSPRMRLAIRTKLSLLVLAVVLPLLAAAAVRFWGDAPDGRRSGQSQLDTANLIAAQLDEVLTGQVESLMAQSSLRTLDGAQDADLESLAARVRERHPFMRRFLAVSADGRVLGTSGYRDGEPKFLGAEAIEAVLRRGAPEVTAPLASPADGRQIVALIVPVQDRQGKAVVAYGAEIDLEALSRYLNALPFGREQTVAIVATGGDVLARSVSPHDLFDKSLARSSEAATLLRTGSGTAEWPAPDGVMYLAGAASMRRAPWLVMAAVPADAVASMGAGRLKRDVTTFGIATLLALLVAWLIGGRMQRSVSAALVERSRELDA